MNEQQYHFYACDGCGTCIMIDATVAAHSPPIEVSGECARCGDEMRYRGSQLLVLLPTE